MGIAIDVTGHQRVERKTPKCGIDTGDCEDRPGTERTDDGPYEFRVADEEFFDRFEEGPRRRGQCGAGRGQRQSTETQQQSLPRLANHLPGKLAAGKASENAGNTLSAGLFGYRPAYCWVVSVSASALMTGAFKAPFTSLPCLVRYTRKGATS